MHIRRLGRGVAAAVVAVAVILPANAMAADPPVVKTGGVTDKTPNQIALLGQVNPKNRDNVLHFFRIGPTTEYGVETARVPISGNSLKNVKVGVGNLAPYTVYHYRLFVQYGNGKVIRGKDRTFRTAKQPLGLTLGANPATVRYGSATTLAGNLSGTENSGRQVVLQQLPWPYGAPGFANAGNAQVTDAAGNFSFPILSVPINTQYRVVMPARDDIISPIVAVGVKPTVGTNVPDKNVKKGNRTRFYGKITPPQPGARVEIQRLASTGSRWLTTATTSARGDGGSYERKPEINMTGKYRVLVTSFTGAYAQTNGRTVKIKAR